MHLVDDGGAALDGAPMKALEALMGTVRPEARERLERYVSLVRTQARRLSLVSRKTVAELGAHVADSAALLRALGPAAVPGGTELADLGSGAGLPGVVVAILCEGVRVVAIDSRNSRIVFLKQVQRELGLANLEVVHCRVENLAGRRMFRLATSRALGSVKGTLGPSLEVLGPGGSLVLFKGPRWPQEERLAAAIAGQHGCAAGWVRKVELPGYGRWTWFVEFHVEQGSPKD